MNVHANNICKLREQRAARATKNALQQCYGERRPLNLPIATICAQITIDQGRFRTVESFGRLCACLWLAFYKQLLHAESAVRNPENALPHCAPELWPSMRRPKAMKCNWKGDVQCLLTAMHNYQLLSHVSIYLRLYKYVPQKNVILHPLGCRVAKSQGPV